VHQEKENRKTVETVAKDATSVLYLLIHEWSE
jgi:hypothetical protein